MVDAVEDAVVAAEADEFYFLPPTINRSNSYTAFSCIYFRMLCYTTIRLTHLRYCTSHSLYILLRGCRPSRSSYITLAEQDKMVTLSADH